METNKDLQMTGLQDKYNRLSIEETTETTEMSEEVAVSAEEVGLFFISLFCIKKKQFCLLLLTDFIYLFFSILLLADSYFDDGFPGNLMKYLVDTKVTVNNLTY